jgi:predicted phosphatase
MAFLRSSCLRNSLLAGHRQGTVLAGVSWTVKFDIYKELRVLSFFFYLKSVGMYLMLSDSSWKLQEIK